jgi:hypothetical protein
LRFYKPSVVVFICNSSYLGGRDQEIVVRVQSRQKISKTPILKNKQNKLGWWGTPVTPATLKAIGIKMVIQADRAKKKCKILPEK